MTDEQSDPAPEKEPLDPPPDPAPQEPLIHVEPELSGTEYKALTDDQILKRDADSGR